MSKPANRILHILAVFLISLFLTNCEEGGSELPNELHGQVVSLDKLPAANVEVGLYSVDYIPADSAGSRLAWTTRTDASGKYAFRNIPSGRYNLVGSRDSLGFFRDSVSVAGVADFGRDSLGLLGRLSGTVRLQPQDDPRNVVIQVMGTDNYVNVDATGAFTLSGLAGGTYRLRAFVSLPNYVPLYRDILVRAGRHDTLQPPLEPFYSGIPVVTDIKATYDTANGVARISWRPVAYPSLLSYLVYRDRADAIALSTASLNTARLTDTVYYDTLYRYLGPERGWSDTLPHAWEYRVRVKATDDGIGKPHQSAPLRAVSPIILTTGFRIERLGGNPQEILKGETVRFVAGYANPTVENRSLAWMHGADTLRKSVLTGKSGKDTLEWTAGSALGPDSLQVSVVDANGKSWSGKLRVKITASRMVGAIQSQGGSMEAHAWRDRIVHLSRDSLGRLAIGLFDPATKRDSLLSTAARADSLDSDLASALSESKLYLFNVSHPGFPGANVLTYDLASGAWDMETNLPANAPTFSAAVLDGNVYALALSGVDRDSAQLFELDPALHAWTARETLEWTSPAFFHLLSAANGRLYAARCMNGPFSTRLFAYDPAADAWIEIPVPTSTRLRRSMLSRMSGLDGSLYFLGGYDMAVSGWFHSEVERFDPTTGTWSVAPGLLMARGLPGVVAIDSSIFIVGGKLNNGNISPNTPTVEEYRPE